jgi:type 1 glutamine amidotransferase
MNRSRFLQTILAGIAFPLLVSCTDAADTAGKIRVLIVDGQNNHAWQETTPVLKKILEHSGRFTVDVATSPAAKSGKMAEFKPKFADYKVIVSNYNGEPWSDETKAAFEAFVQGGGGFVSVHAADNSFPEWKAYNEMIGVGGWGGRTEKDGPYVRYWEGKIIKDLSPGRGGSHGARHPFVLEVRDADHPITKGLPGKFAHAQDELYDRLRGPAENLTVLATAYANPMTGGSGANEPMLMAISYGAGRVFHTTLGHDVVAMKCQTFATTLLRGTEWAATGSVTIPVPKDFPTDTAVVVPEYLK